MDVCLSPVMLKGSAQLLFKPIAAVPKSSTFEWFEYEFSFPDPNNNELWLVFQIFKIDQFSTVLSYSDFDKTRRWSAPCQFYWENKQLRYSLGKADII